MLAFGPLGRASLGCRFGPFSESWALLAGPDGGRHHLQPCQRRGQDGEGREREGRRDQQESTGQPGFRGHQPAGQRPQGANAIDGRLHGGVDPAHQGERRHQLAHRRLADQPQHRPEAHEEEAGGGEGEPLSRRGGEEQAGGHH